MAGFAVIAEGHISSEHAEQIQRFYTAHFNPYLNYHRPCGFAQVRCDQRGRRRRIYRAEDYATPYESSARCQRHIAASKTACDGNFSMDSLTLSATPKRPAA